MVIGKIQFNPQKRYYILQLKYRIFTTDFYVIYTDSYRLIATKTFTTANL